MDKLDNLRARCYLSSSQRFNLRSDTSVDNKNLLHTGGRQQKLSESVTRNYDLSH